MDDEAFRQASKSLMEMAAKISAPLHWQHLDSEGQPVRHNGTAFFLRTKEALFGVTAAHVIEGPYGWRWHCERYGPLPLRLTGWNAATLELNWDARAVDIDLEIDIATFMIAEWEVQKLGCLIFTDMLEPRPPMVGEWVTYCGFPGKGVRRPSHLEWIFGAATATGKLSSVDDRKMRLHIDRSELEPALGQGVPPENYNFRRHQRRSRSPEFPNRRREAALVRAWRRHHRRAKHKR